MGVSTAVRGEKKSERPITPMAPPPQSARLVPQLPTHADHIPVRHLPPSPNGMLPRLLRLLRPRFDLGILWHALYFINIMLTERQCPRCTAERRPGAQHRPWNEAFGHTYVINLERRRDRRAAMEQRLADSGARRFEVIPAVDAHSLESTTWSRRIFRPTAGAKLDTISGVNDRQVAVPESPGAVACYLSHLRVLKDASARNLSSVLILEDDAHVVAPPRVQNLTRAAVLGALPRDWDFLNLGWGGFWQGRKMYRCDEAERQCACGGLKTCRARGQVYDLLGYAVRGSFLKTLVDMLERALRRPSRRFMPVDLEIALFIAASRAVRAYITQPGPLLTQQQSRFADSDIRHFKWANRAKPRSAWARELVHDPAAWGMDVSHR